MADEPNNRDWTGVIRTIERSIKDLKSSKADEKLMNTRFEGAEKMQERLVISITDDIRDIKSDVSQLSDRAAKRSMVQLGGIVALIVAILGGAAFILKMTSQVETNTQQVKTNTQSVNELTNTVIETRKDVQDIKESGALNKNERLSEIRSVFRSVLEEDANSKKKKKKR